MHLDVTYQSIQGQGESELDKEKRAILPAREPACMSFECGAVLPGQIASVPLPCVNSI